MRQRLLETCNATADFAIFSGFGWHRRGDPLKSKKYFVQSCYFWEKKIFCLKSRSKILNFSRCFSLKIFFSLIRLSQIWQQVEVSCAISGLYNLCFKSAIIQKVLRGRVHKSTKFYTTSWNLRRKGWGYLLLYGRNQFWSKANNTKEKVFAILLDHNLQGMLEEIRLFDILKIL